MPKTAKTTGVMQQIEAAIPLAIDPTTAALSSLI
jgi:hypothetical protein